MSKVVFQKTKALTDKEFSFCAGCAHGIIHRLVAETIEELGLLDQAIGISPVGCAVTNYKNFNCDMVQAAHGRAPAVATGIKRVLPDRIVFSYQGDGDLASIGTAEIVHAAHRGENITVIFINNAIYGMTGGQMAPTTLVGQKTSTSPFGRTVEHSVCRFGCRNCLPRFREALILKEFRFTIRPRPESKTGSQESLPDANGKTRLCLNRICVNMPG